MKTAVTAGGLPGIRGIKFGGSSVQIKFVRRSLGINAGKGGVARPG